MNARVKAVLSDGLLVSFLTYFSGTVDPFHLGQARPSPSATISPLCTPLPGRAAPAAHDASNLMPDRDSDRRTNAMIACIIAQVTSKCERPVLAV